MNQEPFSKRHGFRQTNEAEISVRHDAPYELRGVLVDLAYECGFRPKSLRALVCRALRKRPDPNNWSEYPNIDDEVRALLDDCEWHRVYDVIEIIYQEMSNTSFQFEPERFETEINTYFIEKGIGWQLTDGRIEVRGPEAIQQAMKTAMATLSSSGLTTAQQELHEALIDLSRRPEPDITGAIQHSMAALECVAREISENNKATLGEILKRRSTPIPKPLDEAVAKAWGYASENARHIREGLVPSYEEAELIVGICATVSTYLVKKRKA